MFVARLHIMPMTFVWLQEQLPLLLTALFAPTTLLHVEDARTTSISMLAGALCALKVEVSFVVNLVQLLFTVSVLTSKCQRATGSAMTVKLAKNRIIRKWCGSRLGDTGGGQLRFVIQRAFLQTS